MFDFNAVTTSTTNIYITITHRYYDHCYFYWDAEERTRDSDNCTSAI